MSGGSRKVLRTVSSALDKPSERRKSGFSASKGEKEENFEIKLLNLGFLVRSKIVVADREALYVPYFEAATKDGLPFFVELADPYRIARADAGRIGAYDENGCRELASGEEISAVMGALDLLCNAAFDCGGNYSFLVHNDQGEVNQTTVIFDSEKTADSRATAYPLVGQEEILADPDNVLNNIREAWRRLYDLDSERSSDTIRALSRSVNGLVDSHNKFTGTVEQASSTLTDGIAKLVPVQIQLLDQARMGNRDASNTVSVESALAARHAALRSLHEVIAESRSLLDLLEEIKQHLSQLEEAVAGSKDLAVQT